MTYKELPSMDLIQKLMATSFDKPSANRAVFDWGAWAMEHVKFVENERVKLIKLLGEDDGKGNFSVPNESKHEFFEKFGALLNEEILGDIVECPVEESWFDDDRCSYPKEKELWISPKEIQFIMRNKEKQGE